MKLGPQLFGNNVATQWMPRTRGYYAQQYAHPAGAWAPSTGQGPQDRVTQMGGADAQTGMESAVVAVVHAFHEHGTAAGMREARKWGLQSGAALWVSVRADTEEQLAARLASIQAELARQPKNRELMIRRAFVEARLTEVREAVKAGATPKQAVRDRPEIPRREVRRWVPYVALGVGVIALLRSGGS